MLASGCSSADIWLDESRFHFRTRLEDHRQECAVTPLLVEQNFLVLKKHQVSLGLSQNGDSWKDSWYLFSPPHPLRHVHLTDPLFYIEFDTRHIVLFIRFGDFSSGVGHCAQTIGPGWRVRWNLSPYIVLGALSRTQSLGVTDSTSVEKEIFLEGGREYGKLHRQDLIARQDKIHNIAV